MNLCFPYPVQISPPPSLSCDLILFFPQYIVISSENIVAGCPVVSIVTGRHLLETDLSLISSLFLWLYLVLTTKAAINNHFQKHNLMTWNNVLNILWLGKNRQNKYYSRISFGGYVCVCLSIHRNIPFIHTTDKNLGVFTLQTLTSLDGGIPGYFYFLLC